MSATDDINQAGDVVAVQPTCMESVNRIAKLPVVESTIQTAHNIYGKVKDYNSVTNWTLQTAEDTAHKAVDIAKPYAVPVIKNFEGPIKKVDGVLCSGLDYVESKVPAVKLPPREIYNNTKEMVTPAVETAKSYVEPAVETAKSYVEPAVQTAKDYLEPAVAKTRSIVEPIVEPIVENVKHQVDEYLHRNQEAPEGQEQKPAPEGEEQSSQQKSETSPETSFESQRSQGEFNASS